MDTYKGYFEQYKSMADLIKKNPDKDVRLGVFQEGEKLEIKGSLFKITKIIREGLKLKLLPKEGK
jgi:hypothetical protein